MVAKRRTTLTLPSDSDRDSKACCPAFPFLAALAFCLLIARACIQSVTIDEADGFMSFATGGGRLMWYPAAQNHVLNSMPQSLSWNLFGFHQLTLQGLSRRREEDVQLVCVWGE